MGWPRGKKRKSVETETRGSNGVATLEPQQPAASQPSHFDLVLGVRRIRSGAFTGLWELSELSVENNIVRPIKILTDANVKPILIAQIGRALAKCR